MAIIYHSRTEIIALVLQAIHDGGSHVSNAKLLYRTLLPHSQFRGYMELLIGNDLIEYDNIDIGIRIKEQGIAFLNAREHLEEMFPTARPAFSRIYDSFGFA
jgi:predicted transcriptional regulator